MKVLINFPSAIEATLKAFDEEGNEVTVSRLEITPHFYTPDSRVPLLYVETKDVKEQSVQKALLSLSGHTGKVASVDRTKPVHARCDSKASGEGGKKKTTDKPPAESGNGGGAKILRRTTS